MSNSTNRSSPVQVSYSTIPTTYAITPTLLSDSWSQMSAGPSHIMAIKTDGTLWGWGRNNEGQLGNGTFLTTSSPVQISSSSWTSVSSGKDFTMAINKDGLLYGWGLNDAGQIGATTANSGYWTKLVNSISHVLAIRKDGTLWSWGRNDLGQLGQGNTVDRSSPVQIGTLSNWTNIATGALTSFAINNNGSLFAWGRNAQGQIGDGTTINKSSPIQIGSNSWTIITATKNDSIIETVAGITYDGKLFTWGTGTGGMLGDLNVIARSIPVQVGIPYSWNTVSATLTHMVALRSDSTMWTWGDNTQGQLGDNTVISKSSPVQIGTSSWSVVSAGSNHTAGIDIFGKLFTWGYNSGYQLGDGTAISKSSPIQIATGSSFTAISSGDRATFALKTDNTLWVWGDNNAQGYTGQLGLGDTVTRSVPAQLGTSYTSIINAPLYYGLASSINTNGDIAIWGYNTNGGFANSAAVNTYRSSPVQLPASIQQSITQIGTSSWTQVSAGLSHSSAIRSDGLLFSWGSNGYGQLGINDGALVNISSPTQVGTSSYVKVSANGLNTTAITTDGALSAWGDNRYNAAGADSYSTAYSWAQISSGSSHTVAIRADGTLWAWGNNAQGQLGLNDIAPRSSPVQVGTNSWISVSTYGDITPWASTLAVRSDGKLFAWGFNSYGQLGLGDTVIRSSPTQIGTRTWNKVFTFALASSALDSSNALWVWGYNLLGKLGDGTTVDRSSPVQLAAVINSWTMVSLGTSHSAAIRADGKLFAWGYGQYGQLGNGTTNNQSSPVQIGTSSWTSVAVQSSFFQTFAIRSDKKMFGWGYAATGYPLGIPTETTSRSSPVQVNASDWRTLGTPGAYNSAMFAIQDDYTLWSWGVKTLQQQSNVNTTTLLYSWSQISAGISHTLAIRSDGLLYSWGYNGNGELGINSYTSQSSPVAQSGTLWKAASAGDYISAGIKSDGSLWTWGYNAFGQLGLGDTTARPSPVQVGLVSSWSQISVGGSHMVGLSSDNKLYGWGNNSYNQIVGTLSWAKVSSGYYNNGYLRSDGVLFMSGTNANGQLGDGTTISKSYPTQVKSTELFRDVYATSITSNNAVFAISTNNKLFAWGYNGYGALGLSDSIDRSSPTQVGNSSWSMVSGGTYHVSAIRSDGILFSWGNNTYNTYGSPQNFTYMSSPVQIGTKSWRSVSVANDAINYSASASAIDSDYKLWSWGVNNQGQLGTGDISFVSITSTQNGAVEGITFFLTSDNTLWSWGNNSNNTLAIGAQSSSTFVKGTRIDNVSKAYTNGATTSFAIKSDGTLWGWGTAPAGKSLLSGVELSEISAGSVHSMFISKDNTLWFAGLNGYGQLATNSLTTYTTFSSQLGLPNKWAKVSVGGSHTVGIKTDGTLWSWGWNGYYQLGDGTNLDRSSPVQVGSKSNWVQVSCANVSTFALDDDNNLYAWGFNGNQQLGDGTSTTQSTPVLIGLDKFASISNGSLFSNQAMFAIGTDGSLWGWGTNNSGALGFGDTITRSIPTQIGTSSWITISTGDATTSAIDINGRLFIWGNGYYGQFGDNTSSYRSSPVQLGTSSWSMVATTDRSVVAIDAVGRLFAWGLNDLGQLGDGTTISKSSPVQLGTKLFSKVSAGLSYFLALDTSGILWSSGANSVGQLGNSLTEASHLTMTAAGRLTDVSIPIQIGSNSWSQIAVARSSVLGIRTDGTLWAWGSLYYTGNTQTSNDYISPIQIGNSSWSFVSVSKYQDNVLAIKADNTLWAWGYNLAGSLGNGTTTSISSPTQIGAGSWASVNAGNSASYGIKADGTLWSWGESPYGQLGDGTTIARSSPVQVGTSSWTSLGGMESAFGNALAIDINGRLFGWGYNAYGELADSTTIHRSSPVQVAGGGSWSQVTVGMRNFAIKTDGTNWTWSAPSWPINGINVVRSSPVQLPSIGSLLYAAPIKVNSSSWSQVAAGYNHVLGITSDNKLWAWGNNAYGQVYGFGEIAGISDNSAHFYRNDGQAYGWGGNGNLGNNSYTYGVGDGTLTMRATATDITTASPNTFMFSKISGWAFGGSYAISKVDGSLYTWGGHGGYSGSQYVSQSFPTQLSTTIWSGQWIDICINSEIVIAAIKSDGTLWTWGASSAFGSLGNSTTVARSSPVQIGTDTNWSKLFRSNGGFYAIKTTGALFAWGSNGGGVFGNSTTVARSSPVQIGTDSWTMVKSNVNDNGGGVSRYVAIGLQTNGTIWAWGHNDLGQQGRNITSTPTSSPTQIGSLSNWTWVATGGLVSSAINSSGELYTWGSNDLGQLGDGYSTTVSRSSPVQVSSGSGLHRIVEMSSGQIYTAGKYGVYSAGYQVGQQLLLGQGLTDSYTQPSLGIVGAVSTLYYNRSSPYQIGTDTNWSQVSAGEFTSAAIKSDGTLWTWGRNNIGQLGQTNLTLRSSPTQLGTASWTSISNSNSKMGGIIGDSVFTWGSDIYGTFASGASNIYRSSPVQLTSSIGYSIPSLISASSWTQVSAGNRHTLGIKSSDKSLWTWGDNTYGQSGVGPVYSYTLLAANDDTSNNAGFLTSNGLLYLWGYNTYGTLGNNGATGNVYGNAVLVSGKSWLSASVNSGIVLAIDSDYKLWSWGRNAQGQLGDNTVTDRSSPVQIGTSSWASVNAGTSYSTGIKVDGTLWAWGYNAYGQLGDGTTINRSSPVQVAGGGSWSKISGGYFHRIAMKSDGTIWSCGYNNFGQLGNGTTLSQSSPVQVGSSSWSVISTGVNSSYGIRLDGTLWSWGYNNYYELGDGTNINKSSPVQMGTSNNWINIYGGYYSVFAIDKYNKLWAVGYNDSGQFGNDNRTSITSGLTIIYPQFEINHVAPGQAGVIMSVNNNSSQFKYAPWGAGNPYIINDPAPSYRSSPVQIPTGLSTYFATITSPTQVGASSWSKVSAGTYHSLGITISNTLWGWGSNRTGLVGAFTPDTVAEVTTSGYVNNNSGTLYTWGVNATYTVGDFTTQPKSNPVQLLGSWRAVSTNYTSRVAIKSDGTLWTWGDNQYGQLGDGTVITRSSPVQIGSLSNWQHVASGSDAQYALKTDGTLWAWGNNLYGQLGDGTTINKSSPIQIGTSSWTFISANAQSVGGLTIDNSLYMWGYNVAGGLGDGTILHRSNPVQLSGSWTTLNVGYWAGAAIKPDGTLWTWGYNAQGQLGDGTTINKSSPIQIGTSSWTQVSIGRFHSLMIRTDGKLFAVGYNANGGLGDNSVISKSSPIQIGTDSWKLVTSGYHNFSHGVRSDGYTDTIFSWGYNSLTEPALGDGTTVNRSSPVQIGSAMFTETLYSSPVQIGISSWTSVDAGQINSVGIRSDGMLFTWGDNVVGELGDGSTFNRSSPVQIGTSSWSQVSAGNSFTMLTAVTGAFFGTGLNTSGQLAVGSTASSSSPVTLAVTGYGTWGTGDANNFVMPVIVNNSSFTQVVSGQSYAAAVTTTGTVYTWGKNEVGQLGNFNALQATSSSPIILGNLYRTFNISPTQLGTSGWTKVATGYSHAIATKADGTLWGWGSFAGTNPITTSSFKQLAAGTSHVALLQTDGRLWIWGNNSQGQLGLGDTLSRSAPVQIAGSWAYVATGPSSTAAIDSNGMLFTWGAGTSGVLGVGSAIAMSSPMQVGTSSWTKVSVGLRHMLAIQSDYTLWAWGYGAIGVFGDGTTINKSSPTQIGTSSWSQVSASSNAHSAMIDINNNFYTAGSNQFGQLGMNVNNTSSINYFMYKWPSSGYVSAITAFNTTLSVKSDGLVYGAGTNTGYVVDNTGLYRSAPTQLTTTNLFTQVALGQSGAAALGIKTDSTLWAWGTNTNGVLGDGTTINKSNPIQIGTLNNWSLIAQGAGFSVATTKTGELYTWGLNLDGALGLGDTVDRSSPVQITSFKSGTSSPVQLSSLSWSQISAGNNTNLGVTNNALYFWGLNTSYQSGISTSSPIVVSPTVVDGSASYGSAGNTQAGLLK